MPPQLLTAIRRHLAAKNKCLAQLNKSGRAGKATKKRNRERNGRLLQPPSVHFRTNQEGSMDGMSWKQRGVVLLSILAMTLIALAINKAPAGEQTRFYGPDGRSMGTATTSGNTTTFYGADGRRTGSATISGNTTAFYGADGRRSGSATATGKR